VVSVSDGNDAELSVNERPCTPESASISAGDTLRARQTSSAVIGEVRKATVAIGLPNGASKTETAFFSMTSAPDKNPDPFEFGLMEHVPVNTLVESAIVTPTGFNLPATVPAGRGAEYRIDGGAGTKLAGTLYPKQTLQVRLLSHKKTNGFRETYLKVGRVTAYFCTGTH
jgi:hypothetical protein